MIVISGSIPVKPELRDEAAQLALEMQKATCAEPGCRTYCFSFDLADPNTIRIFEEWESEDALNSHFQTEHMKKFQQNAPRLLAGKLSATKYTVSASAALF
jgi:quinol monooxygenase YgiN